MLAAKKINTTIFINFYVIEYREKSWFFVLKNIFEAEN